MHTPLEPTNPELTPQELEHLENMFCKAVERQTKWLDPGIFLVNDGLNRIKFEDIYVVPHLLRKNLQEQKGGPGKIAGSDGKKDREYLIENNIELTIREALTSKNHIVIQGGGGAGKTSLLKYIALKMSTGESLGIGKKMLPVLIPLREYNCKKQFRDFVFHYLNEKIYSLSEDIFHYLLETNMFFFLLDGLDELGSESERLHTIRQVEKFMAQYPHTRMILTSQITGCKSLMGVPCFTLAGFDEDEIKEFLAKRFKSLEPHYNKAVADKLVSIILSEEKTFNLAQNPLLLTMLLVIHKAGRNLPERIADVYEGAVKTVLETWKGIHSEKNILDLDVVLAVLEKTAFNLHCENRTTVKIEVFKTWLKKVADELGYSSKKIDDIIQMLNERAVFVEKDPGLYGFIHQAFQEYFAARYIACETRYFTQSLIKHNMYSSRWREIILLAASMASPKYADLIFDSILNAENDFEEYIHSNVLFAGEALTNQPMLHPSKRNDIINQLKRLTCPDNIDLLRVEAIQILMKIRRLCQFEDMWARELLDDEDCNIRCLAVEYFTTVKVDNTDIKEGIFDLLKDEDFNVRRKAVEYFITEKVDDINTKEKFSELLRDEDLNLRYLALEYFTSLGADDITIKKKFSELLRDEDSYTRNLAIEYFITTKTVDKEITEKFFELLKTKEYYPPYRALRYFTTVKTEDTEITKKFIELLQDENFTVRKQAVEYFTTVREDAADVKKKIFELLKDRNFTVRKQAVEYLTVHRKDAKITEKFSKLLNDNRPYVRECAVRYFTALRDDSTEVKKRILTLLKDEDLNVRYFAVEYLATVMVKDAEIVEKFSELLHDKDWRIRYVAVEYFTALKAHTTEIKRKIYELLKDVDPDVRYRAVRYFTIVRIDDQDIKKEISNLLRDEYSFVRYRALEYLTSLKADDEISKIILPLLSDEDPDIRFMTVDYVTRMKPDTDIKILFELLRDENPDVFELVMKYFITLKADTNVMKKFLDLLSDEDIHVRYRALPYLTIKGQENIDIEKIFELLSNESCSLFPTIQIQDFAVEYLSRYAREESIKKIPILLTSKDESTKKGAYKLMKALLIQ